MQPDPVHECIHQKSGPGKVSDIFQEGHQNQKRDKIRQDNRHSPDDTLHDSIRKKIHKATAQMKGHRLAQRCSRTQKKFLQRIPDHEDDIKESEKNDHQHDVSQKWMHDNVIDTLKPANLGPPLNAAALLHYFKGKMMSFRRYNLVCGSTVS